MPAGGSWRERAPGKYELRVTYRDAAGERHEVSRIWQGPRRGVRAALAALVANVNSGQLAARPPDTVDGFAAEWLRHLRSLGRSPETVAGYEGHLRRYVRPAIGSARLADLTPRDVSRLLRGMQDDGAGIPTIRAVHKTVRA